MDLQHAEYEGNNGDINLHANVKFFSNSNISSSPRKRIIKICQSK